MKVERFINYTVQVTSKSEQHTITGNVNVDNGNFMGVSSAFVKVTGSQENIAEFSWHGVMNLNFQKEMPDEEMCSVIKEMRRFISEARESAESGVFQASISETKETPENI